VENIEPKWTFLATFIDPAKQVSHGMRDTTMCKSILIVCWFKDKQVKFMEKVFLFRVVFKISSSDDQFL